MANEKEPTLQEVDMTPTGLTAARYVCTKAEPWRPELGQRAHHPDAIDDGECSDGCCDFYKCPNCGLRFRVEVAQ